MHFYKVHGLLVRRWMPTDRRKALESWNGEGWTPFADVDSILRHGERLSDDEALALLSETRRGQLSLMPMSAEEAARALRSRLRRA